MPGIWHKLVSGGSSRPSRLHDEQGALVPLSRILRNMPRAVAGGVLRLLTGHLPRRPWISYDAQRVIATFLASRDAPCVLEFGSGQSTRWYAQRSTRIVSFEADPDWYVTVAAQLAGIDGADYRLASSRDEFASPSVTGKFDLVMIDGPWRDDCVAFALDHLADEGLLYLDNSDKFANACEGDVQEARRRLIDFAGQTGRAWQEFTDFAPAQFFVQRGLLVGSKSAC